MGEKKQFNISIIIPLYNESKIFPHLIDRLNSLNKITDLDIEFVLIDDGSKDDTAQLMSALALTDNRYNCIFLSRNYGHQIALTAGLKSARATEAIMVIDGDLQDPPELIIDFYKYYKQGYDVVFAIRKKRKENFIKKFCYFIFYRILKKISYIDIPLDSGDFSLISRRALDVLNKMPEESRFIRGMRTWIGFKQIGIEYERSERFAGTSKYTFRMLLKLAYNGIFNFSEFPVKFITNLGAFTVCISLLYLTITVFKKFVYGTVPEGFTALLFTIILFSGVQMISLGIIGEYVLRIFFQVKGRPLYIIENQVMDKNYLNG